MFMDGDGLGIELGNEDAVSTEASDKRFMFTFDCLNVSYRSKASSRRSEASFASGSGD